MIDISDFNMHKHDIDSSQLKRELIDILKDSSITIKDVSFTSYGKGHSESFHIVFVQKEPEPDNFDKAMEII